jgi:hypothetical protein
MRKNTMMPNGALKHRGMTALLATMMLTACAAQVSAPPAPPPAPEAASKPAAAQSTEPTVAESAPWAAATRDAQVRSALSAQAPDDQSERNYQAYLAHCRASYEASNARIAASGRHDAEYVPVAGFPYLRTDRLMSSYREELAGNLDKLGTWMLQLREYDSIARDIEFTNMGLSKADRAPILNDLRTCAVWLSDAEAGDAPTFARLVAAARIPDAVISSPLPQAVRDAEAARQAQIKARFAAALPPPDPHRAMLWKLGTEAVDATVPLNLQKAQKDELGRVGLVMSQWPALAETLAPQLLMASTSDRPGAPVLTAAGPTIDRKRATIYYLPSYARVGDRMLIQISYFVWFAGSNGKGLDGLIWRVTVDEQARPILYETIRANGFDHLWFPKDGIVARSQNDPLLMQVPQTAPSSGPFAVRLSNGVHDVQRLIASDALQSVRSGKLELRPYEDLMTLAAPGGGTRSLFGADGLVTGIRQPGYAVYEQAGITAPGALRRWGDHRSSPLGALYFDDPMLLRQSFVIDDDTAHAQRVDDLPVTRGAN